MHDPTEPDRHEILSGPGPSRRARKSNKKTLIITASLVGVLVAGGAGYALAANPFQSTRQEQGGAQPAPSRSGGDDEVFKADEDATMGDATTDAPDDGLPADDDSTMGDAVTDNGGNSGDTGTNGSTGSSGSRGTAQTGNGKKPTTSPTKAPTKAPDQPAADNPADGPAGELSGQCAKNGC